MDIFVSARNILMYAFFSRDNKCVGCQKSIRDITKTQPNIINMIIDINDQISTCEIFDILRAL